MIVRRNDAEFVTFDPGFTAGTVLMRPMTDCPLLASVMAPVFFSTSPRRTAIVSRNSWDHGWVISKFSVGRMRGQLDEGPAKTHSPRRRITFLSARRSASRACVVVRCSREPMKISR